MSRKYEPMVIPRKKPNQRDWFEMVKRMNQESVKNGKLRKDKEMKSLHGWIVVNPKGFYLPSTFSWSQRGAKKKCLEGAFRRFNAVISSLFSDWEQAGYRLVKVKMEAKP